jgi:hypothetical protein
MIQRLLLVAAVVLFAFDARAKCAPKYVLRIVTAIEQPDLPADHFARVPKTLYRSGETMARLEEEKNPATGTHLLIVINEPDIWMVNRADMTGQHALDSGPTYVFHAPALGTIESKLWTNLELGCEVPFMKAVGSEPKSLPNGGRVYEHSAEGVSVRLFVTNTDIPTRLEATGPDLDLAIVYKAFEQLRDAPRTLFEKPAGVTFEEKAQ